MTTIDDTHDPSRTSWVESANGHPHFPIQNLPFGVFEPIGGAPRGGVAIGDSILEIREAVRRGLLKGSGAVAAGFATLNAFLEMGAPLRQEVRHAVSELLTTGHEAASETAKCLHTASDCRMHLPCTVGDYSDFYVGIHHATSAGKLFRPDSPLMPNYKYVPVGYHGRASSVRPSGEGIVRPKGQTKAPDAEAPVYGPSARLDFELELAVWVGRGNPLGTSIPIAEAADHIAGYGLLNDWSARDIQAWESAPLGPFLGKSFSTSVSGWIVTPEALAPFRIPQPPRPAGDPAPLPYLSDEADQAGGALGLELEVYLQTPFRRSAGLPPVRIVASHARHMYWTPAQMVAHHTSGGCNLQPGDLLGTGTISGPSDDSLGSLLELSAGGLRAVKLPDGEERFFLEDGDEVILTARAHRDGFVSIGLGECRGVVLSATP